MNFIKPRLVWILLAVGMMAMGCLSDKSTLVIEADGPVQTMQNATIQFTDSGRLQMTMWGEEIHNFDDSLETQEFPQKLQATFYNEDGEVTTIITADEGTNWQKKLLMNLRKNVVIKDLRNGKTTYTEDFYWDQDKRIIYSNVPVLQIDSYGSRYRGSGFDSDEEMTNFNLRNARLDIVLQ